MLEKIYTKITNNKKYTIIFLLILTLLSSIPVFIFPGIKKSDDIYFHLSRICAISDNIKNFDFFKGIYPGYFNDYGYANGLFYPDIFLYIPAILKTLGMNVISAYKIFIIIINFLSILSIYISIKGICKNKYASILGCIIYAFTSYRLVDIYERGALGEALAFIFAPLIIYGIYEIIFRDKNKFYILTIGMTGMILSHIVSTYMMGILLTIICILNIKKIIKEKRYPYIILAAIITLLLTAYFIIPMLEQMKTGKFYYNNTSNISEFELSKRTVPIYLLFLEIPNLRKALFKKFWVPSGIGIIFIYIIYQKIKNKKQEKFINQSYIISVITLLLTSLTPFWKIGIIKKILYPLQFPWRLYIIPTLLLTISGSILISKNKESKKLLLWTSVISMISLTSMLVISMIPPRVKEVVEYDASYAEYLPIEVDREYIKQRKKIITSNNNVEHSFEKKGTNIKIEFKQNNKNTYLELPLIYYKGYNAKIKEQELETFKTENGLLGVKINDIKEGNIDVTYEGTKITKITKIISLISLTTFIIYIKEVKKNEK
jgi:hypothetical protein